jgi:hypothetical protein
LGISPAPAPLSDTEAVKSDQSGSMPESSTIAP